MSAVFYSLRFRLLVFGLLGITALYGMVLFNTDHVLRAVAEDTIKTAIRQTGQTLNLAIAPNTTEAGLSVLKDYFAELVSNGEDGIVYLMLFDEGGKTISATNAAPTLLLSPDRDLRTQIEEGVVHVEQPILIAGNRVGQLRFGLSSRPMQAATQRILVNHLGLLALSLVIVTVMLIVGGMWFNDRLSRLIAASRQLAEGDYTKRAPATGRDELSRLAHHFNLMAQAVEDRIAALESSRAEIAALNASLERRVAERTGELAERNAELGKVIQELRRAQDRLVQAEKLASLGQIVAAVAHELNTPIGNALTIATALVQKTRVFLREVARGLRRSSLDAYVDDATTAADLIERNLQRAADLIASFKHVAVDQTSSQRRVFDLGDTLRELTETLRPSFKNTGHGLTLDLAADIVMDSYPGPLGQIVTNFVTNALLHGFAASARGTMTLSCRPLPGEQAEIRFCDDGQGIPQDQLSRIFDPFFTTRMGSGGTGLGLSIVHRIATGLLGGEIEVESEPGKGTCFRVVFPRKAPVGAAA